MGFLFFFVKKGSVQMKNQRGRSRNNEEQHFNTKAVSISLVSGATAAFIFVILFSFLFSIRDLPLELFQPLGIVIVLVGCILSGFVCAKLMNHQGMMWGGICGSLLFISLVVLSAVFSEATIGITAVSKGIMMITSGMIGGILGVNLRQ